MDRDQEARKKNPLVSRAPGLAKVTTLLAVSSCKGALANPRWRSISPVP